MKCSSLELSEVDRLKPILRPSRNNLDVDNLETTYLELSQGRIKQSAQLASDHLDPNDATSTDEVAPPMLLEVDHLGATPRLSRNRQYDQHD